MPAGAAMKGPAIPDRSPLMRLLVIDAHEARQTTQPIPGATPTVRPQERPLLLRVLEGARLEVGVLTGVPLIHDVITPLNQVPPRHLNGSGIARTIRTTILQRCVPEVAHGLSPLRAASIASRTVSCVYSVVMER